ncbi:MULTISPECIES: S8 family peptidase [Mammaliicoccus]|jgi:subtilisin family serine protease|uniref:S8 family peptidase n=1 Tax=Mammaliicoccus TaxID=2803850 RepID=UPI0011C7E3F4|nr:MULTISPECIES: S8 family serine peptidase [Mammaliicoccus]WHI54510.1 S8 family serine peptidase [Mammaliicoccus lentus]WHI57032.1 S8 family serine peptidase [Mammaliicoccus lentus]
MKRSVKYLFIVIIILIVFFSFYFYKQPNNWTWETLNLTKKDSNNSNTKVAILDTGINNERINNAFVTKKYDAINKRNQITTNSNHATQIASIITYGKHKEKLIGISKTVSIYDVKVLDDELGGETDSIVNGINWSIKNDVDIINMSFGFQRYNKELHDVIKKAKKQGIILVGAAGNNMDDYSDYPARFNEVYSITAIDKNNKPFIYAPTKKVDFKAPGVEVYTLDSKDEFTTVNGTSFAAAYFTSYLTTKLDSRNNLSHVLKKYPIN